MDLNPSQLNRVKNIFLKNKTKGNNRNNRNKREKREYVRPEVTLQDKISSDPVEVKKRLEDYETIQKPEYKYVQPGTCIRYLKKIANGNYKYCSGGTLVVNADPVYWILKSNLWGKDIVWSVQLKNENIYYKKKKSLDVSEKTMQEIYDAIKSGEYKLIKTTDLVTLLNKGGNRVQQMDKYVSGDSKSNSDEESSSSYSESSESSTMESADDSDDERRPTIVHLV